MMRAVACLLLGLAAPAQDQPLLGKAREAFLAKLAARMQRETTVVATFVQEKYYSLFDDVVKQRGTILYQSPDKLRWEIQQPFRSILIVAGTDVAKFEFPKGKRKKLALGRAKDVLLIVMDQIRGWFRGEFEKSAKDYKVDFYGGKAPRIVMRPKSKALRKTVQAFELELSEDLAAVQTVTIRESGGDKTIMRFDRFPKGAKLEAAHFDVTDPRDALPQRPKVETPQGKKPKDKLPGTETPKPVER